MTSKKVALSGTLILLFILYGLHQRQEGAGAASSVVAPNFAALSAAASAAATQTPIGTATPTDTPTPTSTPSATSSTTAAPTAVPTPKPTPKPTPTPAGKYKDGTYTGSVADAYYGSVQVQAVIKGGRITSVNFLQYPNDRGTSIRINSQAMPYLQQEAIIAQSASVNGVSGASDTSMAFIQSLSDALSQAS